MIEKLGVRDRILPAVLLVAMAACTQEPSAPQEGAAMAQEQANVTEEPAREVVVDSFHGVEVADPWRWLEDWDDPDVKAWSEARNAQARAALSDLPGRAGIRARLEALLGSATISYYTLAARPTGLFAMKNQPPKQQPLLVLMSGPDRPDEERVLVDPGELDPDGGTTIDWYVPSPDGALVAVSLSVGGSEAGDVHIFDVSTGQRVHEIIPRVYGGTAGGDLAWLADGSGFFHTRYPREGEQVAEDMAFYQQVWFHALGGDPDEGRYELGEGFPRIAEIRLELDESSGRLLATVQDGDSGRFALYLRGAEGGWNQLTRFDDAHTIARFGPAGDLYVLSRDDAPRGRLLRLPADATSIGDAVVAVPEGENAIATSSFYYFYTPDFLITDSRIYVRYQVGGPQTLAAFDHDGKAVDSPPMPEVASVSGLTPMGGDVVLFSTRTYVEATTWHHFDPADGESTRLPISTRAPVSFADIRVVRQYAESDDGTWVPVNILIPEGAKLDGTDPLLLTAYGGYGLSLAPAMRLSWRVPLDHGVIVAEANIRGGGEYGNAWHRDGTLTKKQNGFDDFAAVIRHLQAEKFTSPERTAIQGGSNGGLLMGATMTQHPELVGAVVSHVGVYDMLRSELTPNGAFNIPEYGTVEDPEQFRALYAYSPYHNVRDGSAYPPTLFLTGANDPRVDPMHSRKMTARLQAANAGDTPILLRTSGSTGHGAGTPLDARIEEYVDVYSFVFAKLGVAVDAR